MQKNINIILALVNMTQKKQHYKPVRNLAEINTLFQNKPIFFTPSEKSYALLYKPANYEVLIKEETQTPEVIATFNPTTSLEQILQTFGNL